ncbi:MAG TPA: DUF4197 domain-containing protein [Gammaproteobacteria bacterium]
MKPTSICLANKALLTAVLLLSLVTSVQGDWWQKGRELLRNVAPATETSSNLSSQKVAAGLKEALRVGSETVVGQLGTLDGFNADPEVRIPLPPSLDRVRTALGRVGMSGMLDDLELKLNRAAEHATPRARQLFMQSIEAMTIEDAMGIYQGPPDAATRYFQDRMSEPLAEEMRPLVAESLAEVGAVQSYDAVMNRYRNLPLVPDIKADLTEHVVDQGMEGIFHYLAREEAAIRQNPVKRTTELLQQVFGAK